MLDGSRATVGDGERRVILELRLGASTAAIGAPPRRYMIYSHSSRAEEFAEPAIAIIKSAFKAPTLARVWLSNSFGALRICWRQVQQ
jgi:hypothetical protein